jgi:hypothetical protein
MIEQQITHSSITPFYRLEKGSMKNNLIDRSMG